MDRFIVVYDGERMLIEDTALPDGEREIFRTGLVSFADDMQVARDFCEGLAEDYNKGTLVINNEA